MHIKADNCKHALQVLDNCWVLLLYCRNSVSLSLWSSVKLHLHLYAFSFFLPSNSLFSNCIFLSTCPFSPFFNFYFYGHIDGSVAQKMFSITLIIFFLLKLVTFIFQQCLKKFSIWKGAKKPLFGCISEVCVIRIHKRASKRFILSLMSFVRCRWSWWGTSATWRMSVWWGRSRARIWPDSGTTVPF